MKLHVFSSRRALTGSSGSEEEKGRLREKAGVQRVTMTGPLTGLVVGVSGLSCGQRANSSSRGALLKRSSAVRSGHSPKANTGSQGTWLTPAEENNKSGALYRLTLKTVPM